MALALLSGCGGGGSEPASSGNVASADELPDIAILDSPDHASYAAMGIFEDITGKFDVGSCYEGTVNSCTIDVNCLALYYNEDMLKAAMAPICVV